MGLVRSVADASMRGRTNGRRWAAVLTLATGLAAAAGCIGAIAEDAPRTLAASRTDKDERLAPDGTQTPESAVTPGAATADEETLMLRMQATADTAVPIGDLDDVLATTGSIAPTGNAAPMQQREGDGTALAFAPTTPAAARNIDVLQSAAGYSARAGRIRASVKLRAKPDNAAGIVSVLAENATVTVIGCDYWCEVDAAGKRGFVFKTFVETKPLSGERAAEQQKP